MQFPAIELRGAPLWGFTYRLIAEWLDLSPKEGEAGALVLDFLLAQGMVLEHGWQDSGGRRVASVIGEIPVASVVEHFSLPGADFPPLNALEVRPGSVRIVGLAFEEYLITARTSG
jgi:hypothetical protein